MGFIVKIASKTLQILLMASAVVAIVGCTRPSIRIVSEPNNAEVYVVSSQNQKRVGKTPLTLEPSDLDGRDGAEVRLIAPGYLPYQVVLPADGMRSTKLEVALEKTVEDSACKDQNASIREVSQSIAQAQSDIYQKKYDRALAQLIALSGRYPRVSVIYDLIGNIHYLKKNLVESLKAYRSSQDIWPNNPTTNRMVNRLRAIVENRFPAEGGL